MGGRFPGMSASPYHSCYSECTSWVVDVVIQTSDGAPRSVQFSAEGGEPPAV